MKKLILLAVCLVLAAYLNGDVKNIDKPLKGEWKPELTKVAELECGNGEFFSRIDSIKTSEDGRVFIADDKNSKIYIFDKNGKYVTAFGKKGEGPGEFRYLESIHVLKDMVVVVGRVHLIYFDTDGKYIKTEKYPSDLEPRVFIDKNRFVSAPSVPSSRTKDTRLKLEIYNIADEKRTVLTEYSAFDKASVSKTKGGQQMVVNMIVGGVTPLMVVAYNDGIIYYGMNDQYRVNMVDLNGKSKGAFVLEGRDKDPFTTDKKKELFTKVKGIPQSTIKVLVNGLPDELTYFDSVEFGNNGMRYLFLSDASDGEEKRVDIFSAEGKYLYKGLLVFEEGLDMKAFHIDGKRVIVAAENEDGEVVASIYSASLK